MRAALAYVFVIGSFGLAYGVALRRPKDAVATASLSVQNATSPRLNSTNFATLAKNFFEKFHHMSGEERVAVAVRCVPDYNAKASAKYPTPKEAFWPMDVDFTNYVEPNEWTDATTVLEVDPTESWFAFLSIDANEDRRLSGAEFFDAVGKDGSSVTWAEPGKTGPGAKPPHSFERDFNDSAHWEDYVKHDDEDLPKHLKEKLEQEKVPAGMTAAAIGKTMAPRSMNSTAFTASAKHFFETFAQMSGKERVAMATRCVPDYNAKASATYATPKEAFWPMDVDFSNHVEPNEWTDATTALEVEPTESWFAFLSIDANDDRRLSGAEFFDAVGKHGSPVIWADPGKTGPGAKPPHSFERDFNDSKHWEDYVKHDDEDLPDHLKKKLEQEKAGAGVTAAAVIKKTVAPSKLNSTAFSASAKKFFETFAQMSGAERVAMATRCVPDYNAKARSKYSSPKEAFWPMDVDFTNYVEPNEWTDATMKLEVDPTESWFAFLSIDANEDRRLSGAEFFDAVGKDGSSVTWAEPGKTGPGAKPPHSFERDFNDSAHWEDYVKHDDEDLPKHLKEKLEQEKVAAYMVAVPNRLNATAFAASAKHFFEALRSMSGKERVEMAARCVPDYNAKASVKYASPKKAFWPMDVDYTNFVEPNEWTDATTALQVDPTESWFAFLSIDANEDRRLSGEEFFDAVGKDGSSVTWAEPGKTGPGAKKPQTFERDFNHSAHWEDYVSHDDDELPKHAEKRLEEEKSRA